MMIMTMIRSVAQQGGLKSATNNGGTLFLFASIIILRKPSCGTLFPRESTRSVEIGMFWKIVPMEIPNVLETFTADCKLGVLEMPRVSRADGVKDHEAREYSCTTQSWTCLTLKTFYFNRARGVAKGTPGEYFKGRKTQRTCNAMSNGWLAGKNRVGEQGPALLIV